MLLPMTADEKGVSAIERRPFCDFDSGGNCTFRGYCPQQTAHKGRRLCRRWDMPAREPREADHEQ